MCRDNQAAAQPHLGGIAAEHAVPWRIPPVDPPARRAPNGQPVSVSGGDLLPRYDQEPVGAASCPYPVGGTGVVVGGDDEVQPRDVGCGGQVAGLVAAVGVDGVQMQVAAVPVEPAARHYRW